MGYAMNLQLQSEQSKLCQGGGKDQQGSSMGWRSWLICWVIEWLLIYSKMAFMQGSVNQDQLDTGLKTGDSLLISLASLLPASFSVSSFSSTSICSTTGSISSCFCTFTPSAYFLPSYFSLISSIFSKFISANRSLSSGCNPSARAIVASWCANAKIWTISASSLMLHLKDSFQRMSMIRSGVICQGAWLIARFSLRIFFSLFGKVPLVSHYSSPPDLKNRFKQRAIMYTLPFSAAAQRAKKQVIFTSILSLSRSAFQTARCCSRQAGQNMRKRQKWGMQPQALKSASSEALIVLGSGGMKSTPPGCSSSTP